MQAIPEPEDSGSSGKQEVAHSEVIPPSVTAATAGLAPIAEQMEGLAATHPSRMGGEATARLILGSLAQTHHGLGQRDAEIRQLRLELDGAKENASRFKILSERLSERLHQSSKYRNIKNLAILFGSVLIGFSLHLHSAGSDFFSVLTLSVLGIILTLVH
jgi:hypothetical protein